MTLLSVKWLVVSNSNELGDYDGRGARISLGPFVIEIQWARWR